MIRSTDETMTGHIATFTGKAFEPLNPDPALVDILDIAHALSNSCRFTGHVKEFYSVAQHSVLCAAIVPEADALPTLMHDASEAYLSDFARPIKQQPGFGPIYKEIEERLMQAISERFGFAWPPPESTKWADNVLLRTEQRDLMPPTFRHEGEDYYPSVIQPWEPKRARQQFLGFFYELTR